MPTPAEAMIVSQRVRCLGIHYVRGWAEALKKKIPLSEPLKTGPGRSAQELFALCQRALESKELGRSFTPVEREVIRARLGSLPRFRVYEAANRLMPIELLCWGLGQGAVGPGVYRWNPAPLHRLLSLETDLSGTPREFLGAPALRARRALVERRDFEQLWAWRVRVAVLPRTIAIKCGPEGDPIPGTDALFARAVAKGAARGEARGWFKPIRGDFPLAGRPFQTAFDGEMTSVGFERTVNERLRAANWLLAPERAWRSTSTATPLGFVLPKPVRGAAWFLKRFLEPRDDSRWWH